MNENLTNPEPTVLAIDTATGGCAVAVCRGADTLATETRVMEQGKGHAEALAPMIERTLKTAGVTPQGLDAICVTNGPGAFTGLRIGLSMARAMALALDVPCVGITTLEAVAAEGEGQPLVVCIESKRDDVYAQAFGADGLPLNEPEAFDGERLKALLATLGEGVLLAGNAARRAQAMLSALGVEVALSPAPELPDPVRLAALGAIRMALGNTPPPQPLYLRPPDAKLPKNADRVRSR